MKNLSPGTTNLVNLTKAKQVFGFVVKEKSNVSMCVAAASDVSVNVRIDFQGRISEGHARGGRELKGTLDKGTYTFSVVATNGNLPANIIVYVRPTLTRRIINFFQ